MKSKEFVLTEDQKFSGIIPGIKYVPTEVLTPYEDLKSQWRTIRSVMVADNKTAEQWATWWIKSRKDTPAEVQWWGHNGWELLLIDGHHRYIACQILNIPLCVKVEAFGVPTENIERFIVNNNEELRQYKQIHESVNPQVFRRGFEKTKSILDSKYMLKAYHGPLLYSPTKKINTSENFHIDAFTAKGVKVGNVTFKVTGNDLEAVFVTVDPKYRRQGIAKEMYIFAKELGNDIIPSTMRIYNGNDFGKGIADLYKGGNKE